MMAFSSINSAIAAHCWKNLRLIATDMDGTLTRQGKFSGDLLQALENLQAADIPVLIVTGRSAGWVSGLVNYLPVQGAIAENGGLYYPADGDQPVFLSTIADITTHRQQLADTYQRLKSQFPQIHESADNRFRITDWTFDNRDLTVHQLEHLNALCTSMDWGFTYSSVQCHIKPTSQDKAIGLIQVLRDYFPQYQPEQVLTVGDSPNDGSLFNPQLFPLSVGVANVLDYTDELDYQNVGDWGSYRTPSSTKRSEVGWGYIGLPQGKFNLNPD